MPQALSKRLVIYEVYVDKFSVNFNGLTTRLGYIRDLGCNTVWLLPHYPSPMVDGGYDVADYLSVRENLGTLKDFEKMCKEANKQGLKVITDLVVNHTSTEHPWFKEARNSKTNSKRDYYLWSINGGEMLSAVNAFPNIKLTNWVYNPFSNDYYFATFYPLQPDLNWDNPEVLDEFLNIADFWANLGVSGFRIDALSHLIKRKHSLSVALPETHNITKAFRQHCDSKHPGCLLIGEVDLNNSSALDYFGNGDECTHLFNFEDSMRLWEYSRSGKSELLEKIKNNASDLPAGCSWIYFLGTHDTLPTKMLSLDEQKALEGFLDPAHSLVDSHDKRIAVRMGEVFRTKELINRAFGALTGVPGDIVIYYGDELGLGNVKTNDFLIDNRQNVRNVFNWEEAKKQMEDPESTYSSVRKLLVP